MCLYIVCCVHMDTGCPSGVTFARKNTFLCAVTTRFLHVVVVRHGCIAPIGLRVFWKISSHCHSNKFQPALLKFLAISSKVVDVLGLRETEAGRRISRPGAVVHSITQQGDGALRLDILRGRPRRREYRSVWIAVKSTHQIRRLLSPLVFTCWAPYR